MSETIEEAVARVTAATDYDDVPERPVLEHDGWHFGERVRATEDNEDEGVFAGDEGYLILEVVGSPEFDNERVYVGLLPDGLTGPVEVSLDGIEAVS